MISTPNDKQKQIALKNAINQSKAQNPNWFDPNSQVVQTNAARVKASNAAYVAKQKIQSSAKPVYSPSIFQVQQPAKTPTAVKKPQLGTAVYSDNGVMKAVPDSRYVQQPSSKIKNINIKKNAEDKRISNQILNYSPQQKPSRFDQNAMNQAKLKQQRELSGTQFNPIGEIAKGATSTFEDYANIANPNHKSKSQINKSIDYLLQGDYDNAGKTITEKPYRLVGELGVEIGSALIPVGPILKVAKIGSTALKASKALKAENEIFGIISNTVKKSSKVKSNQEIYDSPFFNKHYEQVSTTSKSPIKKKTYDKYGEVKEPYFKAKYNPPFGEEKFNSFGFGGKADIVVKKVKNIPANIKRGKNSSIASDVRISGRPEAYAWTDPFKPDRIYINKFWKGATPEKVTNAINHESFHNLLQKKVGHSASRQFDNLMYQSPTTVKKVRKTTGSQYTFDDIFSVNWDRNLG